MIQITVSGDEKDNSHDGDNDDEDNIRLVETMMAQTTKSAMFKITGGADLMVRVLNSSQGNQMGRIINIVTKVT